MDCGLSCVSTRFQLGFILCFPLHRCQQHVVYLLTFHGTMYRNWIGVQQYPPFNSLLLYNYIYIIWLDIIIQEIHTRCYYFSSKMLIFYIWGVAKPFTTAMRPGSSRFSSISIRLEQESMISMHWWRPKRSQHQSPSESKSCKVPVSAKLNLWFSSCNGSQSDLGGTNQKAGRLLLGLKRGWRSLCGSHGAAT